MKKILLLTTKYPTKTGNAWLTNELAECISSRGYHVDVIVLSWEFHDGETKLSEINGVKIYRLRLPRLFYKKNFFLSSLKIIIFSIQF